MLSLAALALLAMPQERFRPPAVPLVTHDPYFSIWSFNDRLTDDWTKHWTGKNHGMCGMVRVDGKTYRWMSPGLGRELPLAEQLACQVLPQITQYRLSAGGVMLTVGLRTGQDIKDAAACSRSDTVLTMTLNAIDGKEHDVSVYFDCSAESVVDTDTQEVEWSRFNFAATGETGQALALWHVGGKPLNRAGDDHRIDWGKLFLLAPDGLTAFGGSASVRRAFVDSGGLPALDDVRMPRPARDDWPVAAWSSGPLRVGDRPQIRSLWLAYDDVYSIEYFGRPLRAAWRSDAGTWMTDVQVLVAVDERARSVPRGHELMESWRNVDGERFANLAVLAYRQCLAAHKIVKDIDGTLLMFSKENFSNGCIGTVDVMYPACPIFLAYNPALLKANLEPVMQYASMPRWKWPFAPHDLGTYPKANGQVYGGGERTEENQMPVEESGNMLIMCAAYLEKSGDKAWVEKYWPKFTQWAEYLKEFGLDPGNQLCTDDFAGHLAHNANLSVKAIVAMACYGRMAQTLGHKTEADEWSKFAKSLVPQWMKLADDGDHYRLAFDKPGTWSQKYNLVWDKVLKLGLFPQEVYDKEVAWYLKHQNKYGLPLDNRADYTKLDWTVWTACLARKKEDFEAIMAPVYKWMNETPDRVPLTDWFDTKTARCVGFRARSVVGGVFMPLLLDR